MSLISPIQSFNNMSTGKKVATIAQGAAAVALTIASVKKGSALQGKNANLLQKFSSGLGYYTGYAAFVVANTVKKGISAISNFFTDNAGKYVEGAKKGINTASQKAIETINNIKDKISK